MHLAYSNTPLINSCVYSELREEGFLFSLKRWASSVGETWTADSAITFVSVYQTTRRHIPEVCRLTMTQEF
jgi:hypothetical protein